MRLTLHTDYALRVLIYLALRPGQRVTIQEIAEHFGISQNHLMKVVHRLGMLKYIRTVRGKNGGMVLDQPPGRLRVGAVVRDMEETFHIVECFSPSGQCRIRSVCKLKGLLSEALGAFMQVLDHYTLADLIENADSLTEVLGIVGDMTTLAHPPGLGAGTGDARPHGSPHADRR